MLMEPVEWATVSLSLRWWLAGTMQLCLSQGSGECLGQSLPFLGKLVLSSPLLMLPLLILLSLPSCNHCSESALVPIPGPQFFLYCKGWVSMRNLLPKLTGGVLSWGESRARLIKAWHPRSVPLQQGLVLSKYALAGGVGVAKAGGEAREAFSKDTSLLPWQIYSL